MAVMVDFRPVMSCRYHFKIKTELTIYTVCMYMKGSVLVIHVHVPYIDYNL